MVKGSSKLGACLFSGRIWNSDVNKCRIINIGSLYVNIPELTIQYKVVKLTFLHSILKLFRGNAPCSSELIVLSDIKIYTFTSIISDTIK